MTARSAANQFMPFSQVITEALTAAPDASGTGVLLARIVDDPRSALHRTLSPDPGAVSRLISGLDDRLPPRDDLLMRTIGEAARRGAQRIESPLLLDPLLDLAPTDVRAELVEAIGTSPGEATASDEP